jgi:DNA-binding transcriptional regulator GbsR (MarR family)
LLADEGTSDEVKKEAEVDKEKLLHVLEYYDWLNRLIDSIESKEIIEYIPKKKVTLKPNRYRFGFFTYLI